jgi:predicted choloylglycine hydrolase
MRTIFHAGVLAVLLGLVGGPVSGQEAFHFPAGKHPGGAELKYVNDLPVLIVSGTPDEIGTGIGALALKPGARVLEYPHDLLRVLKLAGSWDFFVGTGRGMFKRFPEGPKQEVEAIVKAAGVDRDPVIAGNTFFDLKKILACSAVMVEKDRSSTGGPLLARNLDYPSLGYIHQYSLITVYRPKGKHAFAGVGFPGLVGCLSGINDAGLSLGVLEVFDIKSGEEQFDAGGVPYGLCLRRVLEEATTIAEAKKVLEGIRRTTTINVAIADRSGVGVLEVSPKKVLLREPEKGTLTCTNHFCSPAFKPGHPLNVDNTYERFEKLEEVRAWTEKATPESLRKQLHEVRLGTFTLQTMVFEPATLKLHLSIGKTPASAYPLKTIDLGPLLRP